MQNKQAITDEYSRKISEATTQGDKDILQKEMEKSLSSLDLEKLKQGINWELVFGDLDKVSKESLIKVKQQLRDFKNSDEYKNMAVDQKMVIDEALSNIQSTLIDKGGLLADLPVKQQLRDFKNSDEYKNMAVDQKMVIDEALSNIQSTLIDKGGLLADLPGQLSELAMAQEELSHAQEEYNEARSGRIQ